MLRAANVLAETQYASKGDQVLTYDRDLYVTAGNIHLTTNYQRLAVRLANPHAEHSLPSE
jgi:hypothetical protein